MKKEEITALFGKFESISCEVEGIECWSYFLFFAEYA